MKIDRRAALGVVAFPALAALLNACGGGGGGNGGYSGGGGSSSSSSPSSSSSSSSPLPPVIAFSAGSAIQVDNGSPAQRLLRGLAALKGGGLVIVWAESEDVAGPSTIKLRLFTSTGLAAGSEALVHAAGAGTQFVPTVAALASGGFVVTWYAGVLGYGTGEGTDIWAKLFDASGNEASAPFLVNTTRTDDQYNPAIHGLSNGGFVVVWIEGLGSVTPLDRHAKAQMFTPAGTKSSGEILVHRQDVNFFDITVAALGDGGFVVGWTDDTETLGDSDGAAVHIRLFDSSGSNKGEDILVNTQTVADQDFPEIASLANGGFVVTWTDNSRLGDGSDSSAKAQIFTASGVRTGAEFVVETQTTGDQGPAFATGLAGGGFVIGWYENGHFPLSSNGQVFDSAGNKFGDEFVIIAEPRHDEPIGAMTGLANGGFAVAWTEEFPNLPTSVWLRVYTAQY